MIKHNSKITLKNLQIVKNMFANINRSFNVTGANLRDIVDRKEMLRSLPLKDEGTAGEMNIYIDNVSQNDVYPTGNIMAKLFNGVPFKNLPIFNIKVSSNNTIITVTDPNGMTKMIRSCGIEGFKNAKKGTNVAAQATAISIGTNALEKGIKTVRVRIRGLGPGRISAIKGLEMSGLEVVSITDNTRVSWNPPRPKKQRKL